MESSSRSGEVDEALSRLSALSFVGHREAVAALPSIARHGEGVALTWLQASSDLFAHDRECGRIFVRGSVAAEEVSEEVLAWTEQARTFGRWRGSVQALAAFMDNLPVAFGVLGHAGERRWAQIGLLWCRRNLESGAAYFATPVKELSGRQGITGIEALATTAEELFERRNLLLSTYLEGALRVRNLLGHQAVLPWAVRGADVLQAARLRGEAYFRLESEESLSQLLDGMSGYRTRDHQRLLAMLVHAWLGEPVALNDKMWSPEQGRPFVELDASALYLPVILPTREDALLGSLHAAAHLRFGTFDVGVLAALVDTESESPLPLGDLLLELVAPWQGDLTRFLLCFDLCEDLRVDARVGAAVPNYLTRLSQLAERVLGLEGPAQVYRDLGLATLRLALGNADPGLAPEVAERLRPLLMADATVADAFLCAEWLCGHVVLPGLEDEEIREAYLPARGPNLSRVLQAKGRKGEGAPQPGQSEQPRSTPQPADASGEGDGQANADGAEGATGSAQGGAAGAVGRRPGESARRRGNGKTGTMPARERGHPYPEWDYREGRYKREWAWVQERTLAESNASEASRLAARHARTLKQLKRAMQAQKPTRLAPERRQLEGEEIDIEAAVSYVSERHAGRAPSATVYKRRLPNQRDISVILLADLSTSVMQLVPQGGGRLVDRVRAGILLFAESLEVVGDAYSIGGFCSKYRDNVTWYTIKDFDEPLSASVRNTVGGLSGRLATRMGAAIRHAVTRFDGVESRRRLLLIVSDGRPEDYDDGGDRRYLHEDTRMAVKEAVANGVHPFCITVDALGQEYLPQIFGKGHYLVLDQINSLPAKLPEIYLRLRR